MNVGLPGDLGATKLRSRVDSARSRQSGASESNNEGDDVGQTLRPRSHVVQPFPKYQREQFENRRVAVVVGTSHSGIESVEQLFMGVVEEGAATMDLRLLLAGSVDHPAGVVCAKLGVLGPKYTFSSACASCNTAIGAGAELIARDEADLVVVAGTDTVSLSRVAGFGSLRAVGRQPAAALRIGSDNDVGLACGVMYGAERSVETYFASTTCFRCKAGSSS